MKAALIFLFTFVCMYPAVSEYPMEGCDSSKVDSCVPRRPVVIDTDIGSFVDDHFAITFALQSAAYLDVQLIVTTSDDTTARARVLAQLLTTLGQDDIPIGIGIRNDNVTHHTLFGWARHFDLSTYKGGVFEDGVGKMAEVILNSESTVDIIAIGPMTNFPSLLSKYPGVVKKARIRAMAGSIKRGYDNSTTPTAEYNVRLCPPCMTLLLQAGWDVEMAPLDTTGVASLTPALLQGFISSLNRASFALTGALLYICSSAIRHPPCLLAGDTPAFHDAVATLLALPNAAQFADIVKLNITITGDGHSIIDNVNGVPTGVALTWQGGAGLDQYREFLAFVLAS